MKKAINKAERAEVITSLVAAASAKTAQVIVNKLGQLRKEVYVMLLNRWQDTFPGISRPDQLALLRSRGATNLSFQPTVYRLGKPEDKSNSSAGDFGKYVWKNEGTDTEKERRVVLASRILSNCTGVSGTLIDGVTTRWNVSLALSANYPDIIAGSQPTYLYEKGAIIPEKVDPVYNGLLMLKHVKIMALLKELRDLLESAEAAYETLAAALAPVKTAQALAELMPEAVKHFPSTMTYVKPTKEIADPKAINEIRAKLAKGLPI